MSTPADWKRWGEETLDGIRRDLYLPDQKLYAEDNSRDRPSYNWPAGVMLSALNAGARAEPRYRPWLREYLKGLRAYWREDGGFDVYPHMEKPDRYYDDNAWMALALIESSDVLGDPGPLKWAEQTVKFILTGEDDRLGGGLYWREDEKTSKNTCANAPAALACAKLAAKTHDPTYLASALRLYQWTRAKLRDPATNLYWDHLNLKGQVGRTLWSYNSALMIRSGLALTSLTTNLETSRDAYRTTDASIARWLDPAAGLFRDDMAFAHLLFEALVEQAYKPVGLYLSGLHDKAADARGHYGHRWSDLPTGNRTKFRLIDQASAARAYLLAANAATKPRTHLRAPRPRRGTN